MRIAGFRDVEFTAKNGDKIKGKTFFFATKIAPGRGSGEEFERAFMGDDKINKLGFTPVVNQEVKIFYNKYGKIETIELADEDTVLLVD